MEVAEAKWLKPLEEKNARLKKVPTYRSTCRCFVRCSGKNPDSWVEEERRGLGD
jgi:hypothetical protein